MVRPNIRGGAADTYHDSLVGGPGNDTLTGGVGEDLFIFSPGDGEDVIKNFNQAEDGLKLADFGLSGINDLSITTGASDTVITVNNVDDFSITLQGFTGTLVAGDFIFS